MTPTPHQPVTFARYGALFIIAMATLNLVGVMTGTPWMRRLVPTSTFMSINAACGLMASALGILLLSIRKSEPIRQKVRLVVLLLAFVPLLIGITKLLTVVSDIPFTEFAANHPPWKAALSDVALFSPEAAVALVCSGAGLILLLRSSRQAQSGAVSCALVILFIPVASLTAGFFGARYFYSVYITSQKVTGISFLTILCLFALSFSVLLMLPDFEPVKVLTSQTTTGSLTRRVTMLLFGIPPLVGAITYLGIMAGVFEPTLARTAAVVLAFATITVLTWRLAKRLDREERHRLENESVLLSTLDTIPTAVWILDPTGKIQRSNRAALALMPHPRFTNAETGRSWVAKRIPSGEALQAGDWPLTRLLERGTNTINELIEIFGPDGEQKVILNSAIAIGKPPDRVIGSIVTAIDVTTSFRLNRELGILARVGEALIQTAPDEEKAHVVASKCIPELADYCAIYVFNDKARLTRIGDAVAPDAEALFLKDLIESYDAHDLDALGFATVIRHQRSIMVSKKRDDDTHCRPSSGQGVLSCSYLISPILFKEGVIGIVLLMRAGDRRPYTRDEKFASEGMTRMLAFAIENQRSSERLKRAIRAREDVAAIVSHDLRNPLDVVLNAASLIEEEAEQRSANCVDIINYSRMIALAGKRMLVLVHDLLDLSTIEAGRLILERRPTDIVTLVRENLDLQRLNAENRNIRLRLSAPSTLPPINCDRSRVSQVLSNLLANALKFTPTGGQVQVAIREGNHEVEISVSDTGPGIKADHLPHLFDRYWQPSTSAGRGFGLGLFIVKGIVDAHDGTIRVMSEEGHGSTFTFILPSQESQAPADLATALPAKPLYDAPQQGADSSRCDGQEAPT